LRRVQKFHLTLEQKTSKLLLNVTTIL